jgi:hypothetical protein
MQPGCADGPVHFDELFHRPAWMERAACHGQPVELFFPARGADTKETHLICAGCSVRTECLEYATADSELAGIWGDTSAHGRQRMRSVNGTRLRKRLVVSRGRKGARVGDVCPETNASFAALKTSRLAYRNRVTRRVQSKARHHTAMHRRATQQREGAMKTPSGSTRGCLCVSPVAGGLPRSPSLRDRSGPAPWPSR